MNVETSDPVMVMIFDLRPLTELVTTHRTPLEMMAYACNSVCAFANSRLMFLMSSRLRTGKVANRLVIETVVPR